VEGDTLAVVGPDRAAMHIAALRDLTSRAGARVIEELRVAVGLPDEDEACAAARRARLDHRTVTVRELLTHAEGRDDAMNLLVRPEARRDEHAAIRQPVEEGRLPPLLVAPDPGRELRIHGWNAVEDELAVDPMRGDAEGLRVSREAAGDQPCGQGRYGGHPAREKELDHAPSLPEIHHCEECRNAHLLLYPACQIVPQRCPSRDCSGIRMESRPSIRSICIRDTRRRTSCNMAGARRSSMSARTIRCRISWRGWRSSASLASQSITFC